MAAMNWKPISRKKQPAQPELFPELSDDENRIIELLRTDSEGLQVNQMVIELDMPVNRLMPLLFQLEMKNIIRSVAGGRYRVVFST